MIAALARRWLDRIDPPPPPPRVAPKFNYPPKGRINETTLARLMALAAPQSATQEPVKWKIAEPLPGVVPPDAPTMAQDQAFTALYSNTAAFGNLGDSLAWPGYQYLAQLAQRPEYRRLSEVIAKEMTRKWLRFTSSGDGDKSERIAAIEKAWTRMQVRERFRWAAEFDGYFGRSQLFIDLGNSDDRDEQALPLIRDKRKVGRGTLKRLNPVEAMWSYPADYNSTDPLKEDYYRVTSWYVQAKKVHRSRLLTFIGRPVPDILKPAYSFGGLSLSQMAIPYVDNWLRARQSVSDLIASFSTSGLKTNMQAFLSGDDRAGDDFVARVALFQAYRDNRNTMMLDKTTEDWFNVSTPLGTLDKLQAQALEQICAVSGIPLVVYTGITPAGLNASSEGELRTWYAWILAQQEQLFGPNIEILLELTQLSLFGDIDPDIGYQFEPLWELDELGRANVRKVDADTAAVYIDKGVLSPEDERERLASDEDGIYSNIDPDVMPEPQDDGGDDTDGMTDLVAGSPQPHAAATRPAELAA